MALETSTRAVQESSLSMVRAVAQQLTSSDGDPKAQGNIGSGMTVQQQEQQHAALDVVVRLLRVSVESAALSAAPNEEYCTALEWLQMQRGHRCEAGGGCATRGGGGAAEVCNLQVRNRNICQV